MTQKHSKPAVVHMDIRKPGAPLIRRVCERVGNGHLLRGRARLDLSQGRAGRCQPQVVVGLQVHPELRRHPEVFAEAEGDCRRRSTPTSAKAALVGGPGDRPLFAHGLIDSREVQGLRQLIRRNPHGHHEFRA